MRNRLVAITIALSFIAILLPIASASSDKSNTMACCIGKTAGHCDSGIAAKKPAPQSEPMCGRDNPASPALEDDGITIVAEPSHTESHHSHSHTAETNSSGTAAESASLSEPCHMDCGACTSVSSRQQKREKGIAETRAHHTSPSSSIPRHEVLPLAFTSNENWPRINPRGPPASF